MGDLIFLLPILIVFFAILYKIFLFLKKIISFLAKSFNLTIEKADQNKSDNQSQADNIDYLDNYRQTLENKDQKVKSQSIAEKKEELLKKKQPNLENNKKKNIEKDEHNKEKNKREKADSLAGLFSDYSEAEKAVIYNEILSKPKSLQND